jgi:tetratricopeptide (TPR) repeat protein
MAPPNQNSQSPSAKSDSRKRQLAECYQRGMYLSTHEEDYDYAHAMFAECVLHDPGNLQFVEGMIQNLRARSPNRKRGLFAFRRSGSRIKKLRAQKDWSQVFRVGLDLLNTDPWDTTTLRSMADACAGLHHNEVELVYLKQALDAEPKNLDVNRHCARSLGRMGQFDQAIACWHRVEKLAGKDDEAGRMISMLAEEKLKYPGGRPPVSSTKKTAAEPVECQTAEADSPAKDVVLRPQQKLEQAIAQDPKNVTNYLELAALLLGSNQYNAAETLLTRAVSACGDQQSLVDMLGRVRYLRAEEQRMLEEERAAVQNLADAPIRIPWMELGLGAAVLLLVLQLVPSIAVTTWRIIDVRNWSASGWLAFNLIVLMGLIIIRFIPTLRTNARRRRIRRKYPMLKRVP